MAGTTEIYFLRVLEAGKPRPRFWSVRFLVRATSWLADDCLYTMCSHGLSLVCVHSKKAQENALVYILIRTLILLDQGSTLTASFSPNTSLEALSANTVILRGSGLQHMNLGGGAGGHKHSVHNITPIHRIVVSC